MVGISKCDVNAPSIKEKKVSWVKPTIKSKKTNHIVGEGVDQQT